MLTAVGFSRIMVRMNRLPRDRRVQILKAMVEGNSIRAISRMTGAGKNTILRLLEDAGEAFSAYQDRAFRGLTCKRLQLGEIWAFCYAKQRNVMLAEEAPEGAGDIWTSMRRPPRCMQASLCITHDPINCKNLPKSSHPRA
jgi:hypothetical protein